MKLFLCCCLLLTLSCSSGFSSRDIADVEASIRKDSEKKGFTVTEVRMSKASDNTLAGFVRLKKNVPALGDMDFSKVCTATKDSNTGHYTWKCEDR